jgi:hypothetical protein
MTKFGAFTVLAACTVLLFGGVSCRRHSASSQGKPQEGEPHPPDLSQCTRLEILLEDRFLDITEMGPGLLSPEEARYAESLKTIRVTDQEAIRSLAGCLADAEYFPRREHDNPFPRGMVMRWSFTCYRGRAVTSTFFWQINDNTINNGHWFTLKERPNLSLLTPQVEALRVRNECARHMSEIFLRFEHYRNHVGFQVWYPPASSWCGALVKYYEDANSPSSVTEFTKELKCPCAREGRCNYAMNPECKPGSPKDTVLLFEAKPGWNQSGGPELFTFDNHNPKGGCVMLNGPTFKFIRTKEELAQLRWKP